MTKMVTIDLVEGVEGYSIYLNDYRICGNKPWGGGRTVKSWKVPEIEVKNQLSKVNTTSDIKIPAKKTFIRTVTPSGGIMCSWYDKNGRRYRHETTTHTHKDLTSKQTDDLYGFMAYARSHDFNIIDNFDGKHPTRIL